MSHEDSTFQDPKGKFLIRIPSTWKYIEDGEHIENGLYEFEVSEKCTFQIGCKDVDERIQRLIEHNKIPTHNYDFSAIGFVEKFEQDGPIEIYSWTAVVDNLFFFATFLYDSRVKPGKDIGLELFGVRFSLRHLLTFSKEMKKKMRQHSSANSRKKKKDYSDIENWRDLPDKFFGFWSEKDKSEFSKISPLEVDPVKLYSLFNSKTSYQPNGFYDSVRVGKPLDNPIWWDFVIECDKGFIHIWRTAHMLEAIYQFPEELDLKKFFEGNFEKYKQEIEESTNRFDKHTVYINHYESYNACVNTLWEDITKLDLTPPKSPSQHLSNREEVDTYYAELNQFGNNSIKYHALAKSLVLNAAFKIESYLNLVIRIGSLSELNEYPDVLDKFLRQDFSYRVKNLRFYTQIFMEDINMGGSLYKDVKELMTLRNKYVHYEEDKTHNKIGEIFYDRDYPLHPVDEDRPGVKTFKQTYHKPDFATVQKAFETSNKFVKMIETLFLPEVKDGVKYLTRQNPIGYNESKKVYSSVYMPTGLDFFSIGEKKD